MSDITADQVRDAVRERSITSWMLRRCSMCGTGLNYLFADNGVTYDSNCDCVSYWTPPGKRDFESLAQTFNMQTPEWRERLWQDFLAAGSFPTPPGKEGG